MVRIPFLYLARDRGLGAFAVNVLPERSAGLAQHFAKRGVDRFAGVEYRSGVTGSPTIAEALAYLDCQIENVYECGDHVIVIGSVLDLGGQSPADPLIFYAGGYQGLHPVPSWGRRNRTGFVKETNGTADQREYRGPIRR